MLGIKFNGGIVLAADTLGSYGSLARFKNVSRLMKVNDTAVLGGGGDYADFQHISDVLRQKVINEECLNDGFCFSPKSVFSWLSRVLYNRRSDFNPLWNTIVVGGLENGEPFLGYVDKLGISFETDTAASGYGAYIALPLMREAYEKNSNMTELQAKEILDRCLKVLYYRDARSWNRYEFAVVTKDGARVEGPFSSQTDWSIGDMIKGYE